MRGIAAACLTCAPAALPGEGLAALLPAAWAQAELRCAETVTWMSANYGEPLMFSRYPQVGDLGTGRWKTATTTRDWRAGFWPGMLWILAQRTGDPLWRQHAVNWSAALATSQNADHDIGFITLASLGKGRLFHDDLTDPAGDYRSIASQSLITAAGKLEVRFNMPNSSGIPVPAGFVRSWNAPYETPYPVIIDNLMNLEPLFLAYELLGRPPSQRVWFDHALAHARQSVTRHMRPDGGTYHVVKHFEEGPDIGRIERKSTVQGYGDETTWSRGQAWAIHGLATACRYARRDPQTDASDLLAAAEMAADYFIDRLPHNHTMDIHNHRVGDFIPPYDFDAALGEPAGPWNDANDNYNPATGVGLGDRKPGLRTFIPRDSSAAAIAASGLIDLSSLASTATARARYLKAAEDILVSLITYDGDDPGSAPDYFCAAGESAHPGILKGGSERAPGSNLSLSYGDFYFLEALARYEAGEARRRLAPGQSVARIGNDALLSFETSDPAPALSFRVQWTTDPGTAPWTTIAWKTGGGPWNGAAAVESPLPGQGVRVGISRQDAGPRGFFRILTRSLGGDGD
ncbi:MAG: glycoside hydrolase family 88 protein [Akkermansiaceae bacterium]|jgi:hypothetical protein|nr:glycoside hydrolase family 88 protein [Akkermansiaceae bacterium]